MSVFRISLRVQRSSKTLRHVVAETRHGALQFTQQSMHLVLLALLAGLCLVLGILVIGVCARLGEALRLRRALLERIVLGRVVALRLLLLLLRLLLVTLRLARH